MTDLWFEEYPLLIERLRDASSSPNIENKEEFLEGIELLDLSDCGLDSVPSIVKCMKNLKILDLSNNEISGEITANIFPPKLTMLNLASNKISSFSFEGGARSFYRSLYDLNLNNNELSEFPKMLFMAIGLMSLGLESNRIEKVDRTVRIPVSLMELNLSRNQINEVYSGKSGISKCVFVDLSHNEIEEISDRFFKGRIKTLNLIGNPIKDFDFLVEARKNGVSVII